MPHTIAVAGKGGVGKTTTCGMLIDYLCKKKKGPERKMFALFPVPLLFLSHHILILLFLYIFSLV